MLSLLALGIAQASGLVVDTPKQVKALLDSVGYPFAPLGGEGGYGKIARGKAEVTVMMFNEPRQEKGVQTNSVGSLQLSIELGFPKEITTTELGIPESVTAEDLARVDFHIDRTARTAYIPHLGRTVTIAKRIDLRDGLTSERLRTDLDAFWKEGRAFAKAHQGKFETFKPIDWSKTKFDYNLMINFADEPSLHRATDSWGWTWRKGWGASSNGWLFPMEINAGMFWIHEAVNSGHPKNTTFLLMGDFAPPKPWSDQEKDLKWARISPYGQGRYQAWTEVDLKNGIKLGDLHRRIEDFATKVAELAKG